MTRADLRRRLGRAEGLAPAPAASAPAPRPPTGDGPDLAVEAVAAFGKLVSDYLRWGLSPEEALQEAGRPGSEEAVLAKPPAEVTFEDLGLVAERDPGLALRLWEEVKAAARQELRSGHRAARVTEGPPDAWARAQFLAVRAELAEAWRPRDGLEAMLLDQLALWQTLVERWQTSLAAWADIANWGDGRRQVNALGPPRLSEAEAVERSAAMLERVHRMYQRALRALQDLRRRGPAVLVRRAGQVNIAQQQVNVAGAAQ
jgi:hypothetical protein